MKCKNIYERIIWKKLWMIPPGYLMDTKLDFRYVHLQVVSLAEKGGKNVYSIDEGSSKENLTVTFSFSANGKNCCPMIVYPYKRIPEKIAQSLPAEWGVARSDRRWMTCEVFFEYFANIFHAFLVSQGVVFPVVLFVDGHKYLTYQLSFFCVI